MLFSLRGIRLGLVSSLVVVFSPLLIAQSALDESFVVLEKWVETEKLISEEENEWTVEKTSLEDLIALYEEEKEILEERIEEAEKSASEADRKRVELATERDRLKAVQDDIRAIVLKEEEAMKELIRMLPEPLQQEIAPLTRRIPKDSKDTSLSLSQRTQNLVGILTQIDKFNSAVTLVTETREFSDGKLVEVNTIYFGIGVAYYVDKAAEHAGVGVPGPDGWEWTSSLEIGPAVYEAVEIYNGQQQPAYVNLPVTIK